MQLPKNVAKKIATLLESTKISQLRTANAELTQHYHAQQPANAVQTQDQHLAYIAARLPATYAVLRAVLNQLNAYDLEIKSLLDLGAGPGTASLAALECYAQIKELTLVDKDPQFRAIALELLPPVEYLLESLTQFVPQTTYDFVLCSYALNEVNNGAIEKVVARAWKATQQILIIVEPGTPVGFSIIKRVRQQLIEQGGYIVAPCTHHNACPLLDSDWCHFSAHVERSTYHRLAKDAELSYEHEKYSYLIISRQPLSRPLSRIIKRPMPRPGHVIFDLCGETGVHRSTVSKKQKDRYTQARKLVWGDGWDWKDD